MTSGHLACCPDSGGLPLLHGQLTCCPDSGGLPLLHGQLTCCPVYVCCRRTSAAKLASAASTACIEVCT